MINYQPFAKSPKDNWSKIAVIYVSFQVCGWRLLGQNHTVFVVFAMEALVDPAGETIWATQNVSYHLGNIVLCGELDHSTVVKDILITAQSGVRTYRIFKAER